MQPRIVIDFDAEDDGGFAQPGAAAAAAAVAAAGLSSDVATSSKPADMLRTIQSMRLSLKRLEQQKQQAAAAAAAAGAGGGAQSLFSAGGGELDRQAATLQAQASARLLLLMPVR